MTQKVLCPEGASPDALSVPAPHLNDEVRAGEGCLLLQGERPLQHVLCSGLHFWRADLQHHHEARWLSRVPGSLLSRVCMADSWAAHQADADALTEICSCAQGTGLGEELCRRIQPQGRRHPHHCPIGGGKLQGKPCTALLIVPLLPSKVRQLLLFSTRGLF